MPGRAELDLIIGLISNVKAGLPALKMDVEAAAAIVAEALKAPTSAASGKAFAEMFDIDGKSVQEQIKIIENAFTLLQEKIQNVNFRESIGGAGAEFDKVANNLKALETSAVESLGTTAGEISKTTKLLELFANQAKEAKEIMATSPKGSSEWAQADADLKNAIEQQKKFEAELKQLLNNNVNNFKLSKEKEAQIRSEADAKSLAEVKTRLEAELQANKTAQTEKAAIIEQTEAKIAELKGQKGIVPGVIQAMKQELTALKEQGIEKAAEAEAIQAKLNIISKGGVEARLLIENESSAGVKRAMERELQIRTEAMGKTNAQLLAAKKKYLDEAANLEKQLGTSDANPELLAREIAAAKSKAETLLQIAKENTTARAFARKQGLEEELVVEAQATQKIVELQTKLGTEIVAVAKQTQTELSQVKGEGATQAATVAGEKEVAVAKKVGEEVVAVAKQTGTELVKIEEQTQTQVGSAREMYSKRFAGEAYKAVLAAAQESGTQQVKIAEETSQKVAEVTSTGGVKAAEEAAKATVAAAQEAGTKQVQVAEETVAKVSAAKAEGVQKDITAAEMGGAKEIENETRTQSARTQEAKKGADERTNAEAESDAKMSREKKISMDRDIEAWKEFVKEWKYGLDEIAAMEKAALRERAAARAAYAKSTLAEQKAADAEYTNWWKESLNERDAAAKVSATIQAEAQRAVVAAAKESAISVAQAEKEAQEIISQAAKKGSTAKVEAAIAATAKMVQSAKDTEAAYKAAFDAIGKVSAEAFQKMVQSAQESANKTKTSLESAWTGVGGKISQATREVENAMTSISYKFTHVGFQLSMFGSMAIEAFRAPVEEAAKLDKIIKYTTTISEEGARAMAKAGKEGAEGMKAVYDDLRRAAKDMSMDSVYSAEQVAKGLQTLVQAGYSAAEAIKVVPEVLAFATAGMTDMETAVKILVSTMTTFEVPAAQTAATLNTIAAGANTTSADVTTFGNALKFVGPLAHQLGMSLDETVTVLGAFHQAGIRGSMAGTSFTNILRVMLNPTAKARKEMELLGVSLKDAEGNMKPFGTIVDEFAAAMDKVYGATNKVDQAAAANRIFGVRGGPAFTALLAQGSAGLDELSKAMLTQADNQKIAAEMSESLWGKLEKLGNAWTNLKESMGAALGGNSIFGQLITNLTDFTNAISKAIDQSPYLSKLVSGLLALIAVTGGIAALGGAVTLFASMLTSAIGVIGPLGRMLGLMTTEVAAAEAGVAAAGKAASVATPAFSAFLGILGKAVLALAALKGAWDIGNAIYQFIKSFQDANEQIDNGTAKYDKFKKALEEPIKTKKQFEILSEDQKRKEIQRLSEIERAYQGKIQELEVAIQKKSFFGFLAPGDMAEMKTELAKMQREYEAAVKAESYYKLHVYDEKTKTDDIKKVDEATSAIDEILGNKSKGIKSIDGYLAKQIKSIEDTVGKYEELGVAMGKAGEAGGKMGSTITAAHQGVVASAEEVASREIDSQQRVIDAKTATIETFYSYYMDKLSEAEGEDEKSNAKIKEAKQKVYDESITALQAMYDKAVEQQNKYVEDVIKSEEELSRKRIEIHDALQKSLGVDDSVKGQLQKAQELNRQLIDLDKQLQQAKIDGNIAAQKTIAAELVKVQIEANKAASKYAAELVKEQTKLEADLEKDRAALATQREQRTRDLAEKEKGFEEDRKKAVDDISDKRKAADDRHEANIKRLQDDLAASNTAEQGLIKETASQRASADEKQRKLTEQIAAENKKYQQELLKIADDSGEKRVAIEQKVGEARRKSGDTASMDALEAKIKKEEEELKGVKTVLEGNTTEIIRATVEADKLNKALDADPVKKRVAVQETLAGMVERTKKTEEEAVGVYERQNKIAEAKVELGKGVLTNLDAEKEKLTANAEAAGAIGEKGKKGVDGLIQKTIEWFKTFSQNKAGLEADTTKADKALKEFQDRAKNPLKPEVDAKLTSSGEKTLKRVEEPKGGTATVDVKATGETIDWSKRLGVDLVHGKGEIKIDTKIDTADAKRSIDDVLNEVNVLNSKVKEVKVPDDLKRGWDQIKQVEKEAQTEVDGLKRKMEELAGKTNDQGLKIKIQQDYWKLIQDAEAAAKVEVDRITERIRPMAEGFRKASEEAAKIAGMLPKDNNVTYKVQVEGEDKVRSIAVRMNEIPGIIERLKQQKVDFDFKPGEDGIVHVKQAFIDNLVEMRTAGDKSMIGKTVADGIIRDYKETASTIVTTITGPVSDAAGVLTTEGAEIWKKWKESAAGSIEGTGTELQKGTEDLKAFNARTKELGDQLAAEQKATADKSAAERLGVEKAFTDSSTAEAKRRAEEIKAAQEKEFNDSSLYAKAGDAIANALFGPLSTVGEKAGAEAGTKTIESVATAFGGPSAQSLYDKALSVGQETGRKMAGGANETLAATPLKLIPDGVATTQGTTAGTEFGTAAPTAMTAALATAPPKLIPDGAATTQGTTAGTDAGKAVSPALTAAAAASPPALIPAGLATAQGTTAAKDVTVSFKAGMTTASYTEAGSKIGTDIATGTTAAVTSQDPVGTGVQKSQSSTLSRLAGVLSAMSSALQSWASSQDVTIHVKVEKTEIVKVVRQESGGGRYGGLVAFARGMQHGGEIKRMAGGGKLPGYGGGDRRLVLLEDGEYVMPKESTKAWGVSLLNWMRSTTMKGLPKYNVGIPRMATGGSVGAAATMKSASNLQAMGLYKLELTLNDKTTELYGQKNMIKALVSQLSKEAKTTR